MRLGIARALVEYNAGLRKRLKDEGLIQAMLTHADFTLHWTSAS